MEHTANNTSFFDSSLESNKDLLKSFIEDSRSTVGSHIVNPPDEEGFKRRKSVVNKDFTGKKYIVYTFLNM